MTDQLKTILSQSSTQTRKLSQHWIWQDVVIPFVLTRFGLLVTGWFSQYLLPSANYPIQAAIARGWHFSPYRLLDIWGRWDTGWYLNIVDQGYSVRGDYQAVQSNIAFFPLYPYIVKCLTYFIPTQLRTPGAVLLIGIVVSNFLLLCGLILLHELVTSSLRDTAIARRTILYMLLFPTSFFFSCFYSEAVFLFLSVAVFYAGSQQAWGRSSVLGGFLALTRPLGALIMIPLVWMYLAAHEWKLRKIRWDIGFFLLVPIGLLVFPLSIYPLTGNLLAPLQVQTAWGKGLALPWETIINPKDFNAYVTPIDQVVTAGFLLLGLMSLVLLPKSYGIYSLGLILPPLFTGTLISNARYCVVLFPLFIVLAILGKWRVVDKFFTVSFLVVQVLFMAAWSQFYWIG